MLSRPLVGGEARRVEGDEEGQQEREDLRQEQDAEELLHEVAVETEQRGHRHHRGDAGLAEDGAGHVVLARAGRRLDVHQVDDPGEAEEVGVGEVEVRPGPDRAGVQAGHPHRRLHRVDGRGPGAPRMAQADRVAHVDAELAGGPLGQEDPAGAAALPVRQRAGDDRRPPPAGAGVDEVEEQLHLATVRDRDRPDPEARRDVADSWLVGQRRGHERGREEARQLDRHAVRVPAERLPLAGPDRRLERVHHGRHPDEHADRAGDAERGEEAPARRPQDVADRGPPERPPGQRETVREAGEAGPADRPGAGVDRLHRHHPDRPAHREQGGDERDEEADRRGDEERAGQERRLEHRQRHEPHEHVEHRRVEGEADRDPQEDAEGRDLGPHEEGAHRQLPAGDAQGHPDADLAALGLHDPADQVEGGEGRPEQDEQREDREELAVGLDVADDHLVGGIVVAGHHPAADARERGGRAGQVGGHGFPVGAGTDADDEVVDEAGHPGQVLGGGQAGEDAGETGLRHHPAALGHHDEHLRRRGLPDVAGRPPGHHEAAFRGQPVVAAEAVLQGDGGDAVLADGVVRRDQGAPHVRGDAIDGRAAVGELDAYQRPGHEDRLPGSRGVHRDRDDQALGRRRDGRRVVERVDERAERAGRDRGALRQLEAQVVHRELLHARVDGVLPPLGRGDHAGEPAGADRDRQGDGDDEKPALAQVAQRPAEPEPEARHRTALTSGGPRRRPGRRAAGRRRRSARWRAR